MKEKVKTHIKLSFRKKNSILTFLIGIYYEQLYQSGLINSLVDVITFNLYRL